MTPEEFVASLGASQEDEDEEMTPQRFVESLLNPRPSITGSYGPGSGDGYVSISGGGGGYLDTPRMGEGAAQAPPPKVDRWGQAEILSDEFFEEQLAKGYAPARVGHITPGEPYEGQKGSFFAETPRFEHQRVRRVEGIYDADTMWISDPNGNVSKFRFHDIDAAELNSKDPRVRAQAEAARDKLKEEFLRRKTFVMEQPETPTYDKYGRELGMPFKLDERGRWKDLNRPVLKKGAKPERAYGSLISDNAMRVALGKEPEESTRFRPVDEIANQSYGTTALRSLQEEIGGITNMLTAKDPDPESWGITNLGRRAMGAVGLMEPDWAKRWEREGRAGVQRGYAGVGSPTEAVLQTAAQGVGMVWDDILLFGMGLVKGLTGAGRLALEGGPAAQAFLRTRDMRKASKAAKKYKLSGDVRKGVEERFKEGRMDELGGLADDRAVRQFVGDDAKKYALYAEEVERAKRFLGEPTDAMDAARYAEDVHELAHKSLGLDWGGSPRAYERIADKYIVGSEDVGRPRPGHERFKAGYYKLTDTLFNRYGAIDALKDPKLKHYINRTKGAGEHIRRVVNDTTFYYDELTDNIEITGNGFRKIWGGYEPPATADGVAVDLAEFMDDVDRFFVADRELGDIIPRFRAATDEAEAYVYGTNKQGKLRNPKKAGETDVQWKERLQPKVDELARKRAKKKGLGGEFPEAEVIRDQKLVMEGLKAKYGEDGYRQLLGKAVETREWLWNSTIHRLWKLGVLDDAAVTKLQDAGQHYSPITKVSEDVISRLGDESAELLNDLKLVEEQMTAEILKGIGPTVSGGPLKRLRKGLEEDVKQLAPMDAMLLRVSTITKWIEQQRVRNQIWKRMNANPEEAARYGFRNVTDPKNVKSGGGNVYNAWVDGKRYQYQIQDERLHKALEGLSPGAQSLLNKMMEMPVFRGGNTINRMFRASVVRGLEFMMRNPIRDQFQAAMYSKFGFVPFLTAITGAYHRVKGDKYSRAFDLSGAPLATNRSMDVGRLGALRQEATMAPEVRHITDPTSPDTGQFFGRRSVGQFAGDNARLMGAPGTEFGSEVLKNALTDSYYTPDVMKQAAGMVAHETTRRLRDIRGSGSTARSMADILKPSAEKVRIAAQREHRAPTRLGQGWWGFISGSGSLSEFMEISTRLGAFAKGMKRAEGKGWVNRVARRINKESQIGTGYSLLRSVDEALLNRQSGESFSEAFTRAYNKPKNLGHLSEEAREITLDFMRSGEFGETLNALMAFANAELQDISRFKRALTETPTTTITKGLSMLTVPAALNWYAHAADPEYQSLSAAERRMFLHLWKDPDTGKYVRIPLPPSMVTAMFASSVQAALDYWAWNNPGKARELLSSLNPDMDIDPREFDAQINEMKKQRLRVGDPESVQEFLNAVMNFSPQRVLNPANIRAITPLFELWANESLLREAPIYSQRYRDASGNMKMTPELTVNAQTRAIDEQIAAALRGTGIPGLTEIDPIAVNHVISGYLATLGRMGTDIANKGIREIWGDEISPNPEVGRHWQELIPGLKGFLSVNPVGPGSLPVRRFYDRRTENDRKIRSLRELARRGDPHAVRKMQLDHPEMMLYEIYKDAGTHLSNLSKELAEVRSDKTLKGEDAEFVRREEMDRISWEMSQFAMMVNQTVDILTEEIQGAAKTDGKQVSAPDAILDEENYSSFLSIFGGKQ